MVLPFFHAPRSERGPVGPRGPLAFPRGLADGFCHPGRAAVVRDERHPDWLDRAFARAFRKTGRIDGAEMRSSRALPEDWRARAAPRPPGGFEALTQTLRRRRESQEGRHQGGSGPIGAAGPSRFGTCGFDPGGPRLGRDAHCLRSAVRIRGQGAFPDLVDRARIGPRGMNVAVRRQRCGARDGAAHEPDLDGAVRAGARQVRLAMQTRPERRYAGKVGRFPGVGGSMDGHVRVVKDPVLAACAELGHLMCRYFHDCLRDGVRRNRRRRRDGRAPTAGAHRSCGRGWTRLFVSDAGRSADEIARAGGAAGHRTAGPVGQCRKRARAQRPSQSWPCPEPGARMFPMTLGRPGLGRRART